jgi:hypothetical protein
MRVFSSPVGHISLQEGAIFILDLVVLSVRSHPIAKRLITRVSSHPIYKLAMFYKSLEARFIGAEFT